MTNYYLLFVFGIVGVMIVPLAQAQVEVKQSTTINGQTTSAIHCLGIVKNCTWSSFFLKLLQGGAINLTEKPGGILIHSCATPLNSFTARPYNCHTYDILNNGTISEVNQSK